MYLLFTYIIQQDNSSIPIHITSFCCRYRHIIIFIINTYSIRYIWNTVVGMNIINNYMKIWPVGKPRSYSIVNQVGDTISSIIGWYTVYYIDKIGGHYDWYDPYMVL